MMSRITRQEQKDKLIKSLEDTKTLVEETPCDDLVIPTFPHAYTEMKLVDGKFVSLMGIDVVIKFTIETYNT